MARKGSPSAGFDTSPTRPLIVGRIAAKRLTISVGPSDAEVSIEVSGDTVVVRS